jgi:hypothetical protein
VEPFLDVVVEGFVDKHPIVFCHYTRVFVEVRFPSVLTSDTVKRKSGNASTFDSKIGCHSLDSCSRTQKYFRHSSELIHFSLVTKRCQH